MHMHKQRGGNLVEIPVTGYQKYLTSTMIIDPGTDARVAMTTRRCRGAVARTGVGRHAIIISGNIAATLHSERCDQRRVE